MTLGERIRKVRKDLGLTQQEFAGRIGTTANVLTNYETGRRNPSASAFNNICKTFNISEEWLRIEDGEVFLPTPETSIDQLVKEFHLGDMEKQIILEFVQLDDKDRKGVIEYIRRLAQNRAFQGKKKSTQLSENAIEQEADKFAAMARAQFLAEKIQESPTSSVKESVGAKPA
ncbi:hypothetical protein C814_00826 [Anaerotruncus sp. G3(2012)]|uniref:helix-turn-helix domain-containing protein n=1 Tax=Anaerotruncus sp. G3(2012) TaxID=1235835 RepID=UPI00033FE339|nr:helix-turn-helix domain-containing protein [Anaerotruncus sp. G3(2012)]EOS63352.1 hypothetical protein C814_00826 [Anaerotruncus sp. G3(2012)]